MIHELSNFLEAQMVLPEFLAENQWLPLWGFTLKQLSSHTLSLLPEALVKINISSSDKACH